MVIPLDKRLIGVQTLTSRDRQFTVIIPRANPEETADIFQEAYAKIWYKDLNTHPNNEKVMTDIKGLTVNITTLRSTVNMGS